MNPYRIEARKPDAADKPPDHHDDTAIVWVWLISGAILIMTDIGRPGPWGAWSSLGMLISGLAIVALWRYHAAKWSRYWTARKATRSQREV